MCWSFDHRTGMNKIFLNGELRGSFILELKEIKKAFPGAEKTFSSALIIGQEPDPPYPDGGFDKDQVFAGDFTELNIWDRPLDEELIADLGKCKSFSKGNVVAWDIKNFEVNKAVVENLNDFHDLCKSDDNFLVFSTKQSWPEAWATCRAHGGIIYTPQSEEENLHLLDIMKPHEEKCREPVLKKLTWLGIKARKSVWYTMGEREDHLTRLKYTNWLASSQPYFADYDCGFIYTNGIWDSDQSAQNCNKDIRLCTVCRTYGIFFHLICFHLSK